MSGGKAAGGADQVKKAKEPVIGRSLSSNTTTDQVSARTSGTDDSSFRLTNGHCGSLSDIDKQISTIQNEFEAELDGLIDAYRKIQHSQRSRAEDKGWFEDYKS